MVQKDTEPTCHVQSSDAVAECHRFYRVLRFAGSLKSYSAYRWVLHFWHSVRIAASDLRTVSILSKLSLIYIATSPLIPYGLAYSRIYSATFWYFIWDLICSFAMIFIAHFNHETHPTACLVRQLFHDLLWTVSPAASPFTSFVYKPLGSCSFPSAFAISYILAFPLLVAADIAYTVAPMFVSDCLNPVSIICDDSSLSNRFPTASSTVWNLMFCDQQDRYEGWISIRILHSEKISTGSMHSIHLNKNLMISVYIDKIHIQRRY